MLHFLYYGLSRFMMEKISSGNPADRGWRAAAVILFLNVSNDPVAPSGGSACRLFP
jgi:hypothetical protein